MGTADLANTWWTTNIEEVDWPSCAVDNEEVGMPRLLSDGHHFIYLRISKHHVQV